MKKLTSKVLTSTIKMGVLTLVAGFSLATSGHAQIISVNFPGFGGGAVTGTAGAGAAATGDWNNTSNGGGAENGSLGGLITSEGSGTSASVSWTGDAHASNYSNADGGDYTLYDGALNSTNGNVRTITVSGLSSVLNDYGDSFASDGYDIYVYTSSGDFNYRSVNVGLVGGATYDNVSADPFNGTFTQATDTTGGSNSSANYLEFTNVTGNSFTLDYTAGFYAGVAGVQVVSLAPAPIETPEPSTYMMLLCGAGTLMFVLRLRKNKVV